MRKEDLKNQIFTVPNFLTFLRFLSVPFFMWCTLDPSTYLQVGPYRLPVVGLIIMAAAAATDLFDGFIARRFNQGSDLGIMLDPFADKLMHVMAILSLTIIGYIHWAFIVAIALKELTMIVGGFFMANHSRLIQANMMGKVASFTLSIAVFMSYFHPFFADKAFYADWIVIGIGVVLTYAAFFNYLGQALRIIKAIFASKRNGTTVAHELGESEEEKPDQSSEQK